VLKCRRGQFRRRCFMDIQFGKPGDCMRLRNGGGMETRVTRSLYKGVEYVDIRKYYLDAPDNATAQQMAEPPAEFFKPTPKGISLTPDKFMELMEEVLNPLYDDIGCGKVKFGKPEKEA
jgi:hypothetical protein